LRKQLAGSAWTKSERASLAIAAGLKGPERATMKEAKQSGPKNAFRILITKQAAELFPSAAIAFIVFWLHT
jgi:hypothetical protein